MSKVSERRRRSATRLRHSLPLLGDCGRRVRGALLSAGGMTIRQTTLGERGGGLGLTRPGSPTRRHEGKGERQCDHGQPSIQVVYERCAELLTSSWQAEEGVERLEKGWWKAGMVLMGYAEKLIALTRLIMALASQGSSPGGAASCHCPDKLDGRLDEVNKERAG